MKELSIEQKAQAYDKALEIISDYYQKIEYSSLSCASNDREVLEKAFPELAESEDERIRKELIRMVKEDWPGRGDVIDWLEKQGELVNSLSKGLDNAHKRIDGLIQKNNSLIEQLEKQGDSNKEYWRGYREGKQEILDKYAELEKQGEQKSINDLTPQKAMDIAVAKCFDEQKPYGQREECVDCQFNYAGECKGYCAMKRGEQNLVNFEEAEKEKSDFVSGKFIQCRKSFNEFKEDNSYWLEYIGDDTYIGRSDNILNQKFHITPRQLYRLFSQEHCIKK